MSPPEAAALPAQVHHGSDEVAPVKLAQILSEKQMRAARSAARSGHYQVLLGAGVSIGSKNKRGPLPDAKGLVAHLAQRFPSAPISEDESLPRAYQRTILVSSSDKLWRILKDLFGGAHHDKWFQVFTTLPWRKVWTLNVDDCFENSYQACARPNARKIRTISWDDPYAQTSDLEVVHLHGHVIGNQPRRLVFSFTEYLEATKQSVIWDEVLASSLGSQPMIILGARLLGDPDIEKLLMGNRPTANAPSIVVDPHVSDGNAWELTRLGYTIYNGDAKEFFIDWCEEFGFSTTDAYESGFEELASTPQLDRLQANIASPAPRTHDYFGGDEPLWSDIADTDEYLAALFPWMRGVVSDIEQWSNDSKHKPTMHIVYSDRLSGLSSGLLSIAREATMHHLTALLFNKSTRLDVQQTIDILRGRGPVLILADEGADFADDFDALLTEAKKEDGVEVYLLVGETASNDLRLEGRISENNIRKVTQVGHRLRYREAEAMVEQLEKFGRLGTLEEVNNKRDRIGHFINRDVFSAMMEVEHAAGFERRITAELEKISDEWMRQLVALVSLASQGGNQVELVEACAAIRRSPNQVIGELKKNEHLDALVEYYNGLLFARQRDQAIRHAVHLWGAEATMGYIRSMVANLAPLATPESLRARNRPALLVGHLMSAKTLRPIAGNSNLDSFYEDLRDKFGDWSARYWEQRAIYAKSVGNWGRAESYSARAVSLLDDAFTRTTHGTILINKATDLSANRDELWLDYYSRGQEQFTMATSIGHKKRATVNRVTTFAYLQATITLFETLVKWLEQSYDSNLFDSASAVSTHWQQSYAPLRVGLGPNNKLKSVHRAEDLSHRWEAAQRRLDMSRPLPN